MLADHMEELANTFGWKSAQTPVQPNLWHLPLDDLDIWIRGISNEYALFLGVVVPMEDEDTEAQIIKKAQKLQLELAGKHSSILAYEQEKDSVIPNLRNNSLIVQTQVVFRCAYNAFQEQLNTFIQEYRWLRDEFAAQSEPAPSPFAFLSQMPL